MDVHGRTLPIRDGDDRDNPSAHPLTSLALSRQQILLRVSKLGTEHSPVTRSDAAFSYYRGGQRWPAVHACIPSPGIIQTSLSGVVTTRNPFLVLDAINATPDENLTLAFDDFW